jgi:protein-S-isoprenylcysteine O-methyltransferase Ste14
MASWAKTARRWRVALSFLIAAASLTLAQPTPLSIAAGAGFLLAGLALRAIASGHIDKDVRLAVTGPYAHTRHPLYLGSVLIATGFVIAAHSWWVAAAACVLFLAVYLPMITAEEDYLRATFADYPDYAASVPRFALRVTPYRAGALAERPRFSRELYLWHREYNAALCAILMLGALLLKLR